ncbi:hypothetical protein [Antarctobacter heliothermus]|uniref:hypothetical protein n=1 Tax=Antarctobacter heliothermus TaxID=74033 RepID=UPI0014824B88|nr:hypothetical protein [Antarctobacter heliothermus]
MNHQQCIPRLCSRLKNQWNMPAHRSVGVAVDLQDNRINVRDRSNFDRQHIKALDIANEVHLTKVEVHLHCLDFGESQRGDTVIKIAVPGRDQLVVGQKGGRAESDELVTLDPEPADRIKVFDLPPIGRPQANIQPPDKSRQILDLFLGPANRLPEAPSLLCLVKKELFEGGFELLGSVQPEVTCVLGMGLNTQTRQKQGKQQTKSNHRNYSGLEITDAA